MYIVEVKQHLLTYEKEYVRKSFAIKCAQKVVADGFIYYPNTELPKCCRIVYPDSVKVYSDESPYEEIIFK